MTDKQKNNQEQFQNCCEGMDFAGMMESMMSKKEEPCGCGCMEMMKKMMAKLSEPQNQEKQTTD